MLTVASSLFTAAELAEDRAEFATLLTDTCRIKRVNPVDQGVLNETTGQYPAATSTVVYEGPCRVQVKADINSNLVETTAGEREWTYVTETLQLPVVTPAGAVGSVNDVDVDMVCTILTAPHSPRLVGLETNIQGQIGPKSHEVYLRFRLKGPVG